MAIQHLPRYELPPHPFICLCEGLSGPSSELDSAAPDAPEPEKRLRSERNVRWRILGLTDPLNVTRTSTPPSIRALMNQHTIRDGR